MIEHAAIASDTPPATPSQAATRGYLLLALLAMTLLVAFAYHGVDRNSFHFDDWPNILDNAALRMTHLGAGALIDAARGAFLPLRPVPSVSFAIDWWRGGSDAAPFLITNLVFHLLTAWAVFALLLRVLAKDRPATLPTVLACSAAALWWAAQPIHVQAVSYIVQRMTEMAALFAVLCVWAYLKGRTASRARGLWWALSALSLALAALSKENAWITPVLVLMAEFLVLRNDGKLVRSRRDMLLLLIPACAAITLLADLAFKGPISQWALSGYATRSFTLAERLLTQPKVVLFHLSQIAWPLPHRFSLEHDLGIVRSAASPDFWIPLMAILAWCLAGIALAARRGSRVAGFFVLWLPATLLIESSLIPLEMVFEHRMYLPAVGLAGLIALGLEHAARRRGAALPSAGLVFVAATSLALWSTSERIPQWRTDASLYEQAVLRAPRSARAWNHLGVANLAQHRGETVSRDRYLRALDAFDRAIALDPKYAAPLTNRGVARYVQGDIAGAQSDLEKAIAVSSREAAAQHYLGEIYLQTERFSEARTARRRACALGVSIDCNR
ncbi:tetratricopeptide repeat protein [Azoarcus sp. CIB]|uniref:tetratricopeptide repeat protein n=1 Tax=Aromatoleum sp. (strain CIB) TaxID=198107 RepID=UPI000A5B48D7|nr:tetratricopeptide repeat protein [Azoarcus sp. CIB]